MLVGYVENLKYTGKKYLIYLLPIFAIILETIPTSSKIFFGINPSIEIALIFYFTINKNLFGYWFIFLIGLWNDALNYNLIGISAISYILVVRLFLFFNEKLLIRGGFLQIWIQYFFFLMFIMLVKWIIFSLNFNSPYPFSKILISMIISFLIYPLLHRFLNNVSLNKYSK